MAKKTPKYNAAKEIVKDIDLAIAYAEVVQDRHTLDMLKSLRKRIIEFDNDLWAQTEEMAKYLPV